ncbi:MAG: phosphoglycerate dehydrogenase [Deltaproteobacteria bacterium]|nr:phosphoglycerate dehydrogenase [Deltaproteobacteria bacterium]
MSPSIDVREHRSLTGFTVAGSFILGNDAMGDLKEKRILVTPTSFGKACPGLRKTLEDAVGEVIYNTTGRPLSAVELISLLHDIDGYIAGLDEINGSVIKAANRLKVISRYGTGVDRVDLTEATRRGIVVTNTPGANAVAVAELTICLMLALARNLCEANQATHQGRWPRYTGIGLRGKTIGLVGFGSIGKEVALRLKHFGCLLLATDPAIDFNTAQKIGVGIVSFKHLISRSDMVSLHLPVTASTVKMINHETLQQMKPGAFLINTARGELVDEKALFEALESNHLAGAAFDVFSQEPPDKNNLLLKNPKVICTPHMGARTDDAMNQMGTIAMQDCLAVLRGERALNVVNPEVYSR